jgi:hypothetical protein
MGGEDAEVPAEVLAGPNNRRMLIANGVEERMF